MSDIVKSSVVLRNHIYLIILLLCFLFVPRGSIPRYLSCRVCCVVGIFCISLGIYLVFWCLFFFRIRCIYRLFCVFSWMQSEPE